MIEAKKTVPEELGEVHRVQKDDDGMVSIASILSRYDEKVNRKSDVPISVIVAIRSMLENNRAEYDRCTEYISNYDIIRKFVDDVDEF